MAPTSSSTTSNMDTPWSWVILACSFTCSFCFSLFNTSVAMIQVEMIEDLGFGSGVVSIMTACAVGFNTLLGPLSGLIASFITIRFTVILGTILMSLSVLCTAFSNSLPSLLIFYGILTGIGHGIAYTPCIVILYSYFKKRLILATGIMTSASSLAHLSLPYLHRYIIEEYGWRFSFALTAALILHVIVMASFFKPTPQERMALVSVRSCCARQGDASKNGSECDDNDLNEEGEEVEVGKHDEKSVKLPEEALFLSKESVGSKEYSKKIDMLIKSTDNISLGSKGLSVNGTSRPYIPIYINGTPKLRSPVSEFMAAHSPSLRRSLLSDDGDLSRGGHGYGRSISQISSVSTLSVDDEPASPTPGTASVVAMTTKADSPHKFGQLRKGGRSHLGSSLAFVSMDLGSSIMLPVAIEEIEHNDLELVEESFKARVKRIISCKPLWIMCVNALCFMWACGTHGVHLPSYVVNIGISFDRVADIYLVFGSFLTLGRLGGGALYNKLKPPLIPLLFVLQILNGLFLMMAPFYATNLEGLFVLEAALGLVYGQGFMIQAPIVTQILGVQDLSIGFGFIQLFNGLGFICAPIVAGFLFDLTGSFSIPFHIGGAALVGGSFFILLLRFVLKKEQQENAAMEADEEETGETNATMDGVETA